MTDHPHLRIPGPDAIIAANQAAPRPADTAAAIMAGAAPVPHPTAANPPMGLDDTARHLAALAEEPYGLDRIRAVLLGLIDRAQEAEAETWREKIRDYADGRAGTSRERADLARSYLPHDPNRAAVEITWAASLADQAAALRSLL